MFTYRMLQYELAMLCDKAQSPYDMEEIEKISRGSKRLNLKIERAVTQVLLIEKRQRLNKMGIL